MQVMVYNPTKNPKGYIRKGHMVQVPAFGNIVVTADAARELLEKYSDLTVVPAGFGGNQKGREQGAAPGAEPAVGVGNVSIGHCFSETEKKVLDESGQHQSLGILRFLEPRIADLKGISGTQAVKGLHKDALQEMILLVLQGRNDAAVERMERELNDLADPVVVQDEDKSTGKE